ncbi:MAG: zinc ribbon domain-containing protein, partial [Metallosphaera sp.]
MSNTRNGTKTRQDNEDRSEGIDPAYMSQTCSRCGYKVKLGLSDRVFHCP